MVRITSSVVALLFVIPALAAPVSIEQIEAREPNFGSIIKGVKKVATRKNFQTAAKIASYFFRRELGADELLELSERDLDEFASGIEELSKREPNGWHNFLHDVKKVATPHNIKTVANIVKAFVRRDLEDEAAELVARDTSIDGLD